MKIFYISLILTAVNFSCKEKLPPAAKTETFKVWGNCGMCEKTIESSLTGDNIFKAEWNKDSKMITVIYDTIQYSLIDIHKKIATAGYDTELEKGSDSAYKTLPQCCQYERRENK